MFITLEGADFSGKTTMSLVIKEYFEKLGRSVILTQEPGGTALGSKLRKILTEEDVVADPIDVTTQILLFYAARIHHVNNVIIPALIHGNVVISDRFIDSSMVYQGLLYKHTDVIEQLVSIDKLKYLKVRPDYTFFYDIDFDTMLTRMKTRQGHNSLDLKYAALKEEPINCFKQHFYELNKQDYSSIKIIDACQDIEVVKEATIALASRCNTLHLSHVRNTTKDKQNTYIKKVLKALE